MSRKLASVQKIVALNPILGADLIEVATVLGWQVVVKKGDFAVGDLAVYYEIDSFLSATDKRYASFEERFVNWGDKRGMRLKTIKLRKQLSQGLVLKISEFPEIKNPQEGDDVTELLKIEKWESLSESNSNAGGQGKNPGASQFPSFIQKTDQERIQNYTFEIARHLDDEDFEASIKLDGSSMTVFRLAKGSAQFDKAMLDIEIRELRRKGFFGKLWYKLNKKLGRIKTPTELTGLCSRNIQLDPEEGNHFSTFVKQNQIIEKLRTLAIGNIAIQGELIAPSIQNNYEKVDAFAYYIYDVYDIDNQTYMLPEQARAVATTLGLNYVPVLEKNLKISTFIADPADLPLIQQRDPVALKRLVDAILAYAEGPGMNKGVKREGVVLKSNKNGFSFKAISNSYLLNKKD